MSAAGLFVGSLTRPFETLFYAAPLGFGILFGLVRGLRNPEWRWNSRLIMPFAIAAGFVLLALGIFNGQVSGNWKQFPHTAYEKNYTPHAVRFLWEKKSSAASESFAQSLPEPFQRMKELFRPARNAHRKFLANEVRKLP